MNDFIKEWISKAEEDLIVINRLTFDGIYAHSAVCFHCQQLVEKYLKIYLLYNGKEIPKTHNIEFIIFQCADIDPDFFNINPKNLSDFGVQIRYPGDFYLPTDNEVLEYKRISLEIKDFIVSKLPQLK